jgi:hypothetical protein
MMTVDSKCLVWSRVRCLLMCVASTHFLFACGGSKGDSGGGSPPPPQNQPTKNDTVEAADLEIHYRDLPSGELTVLDSSSGILGETNFSCSRNGYGLAIYKSKTTGDQKVRVCCVNMDVTGLAKDNAKFVVREGSLYKIKPEACDVVAVSGNTTGPDQVSFDFSGQQLAVLSDSEVLAKIKKQTIKGADNKTQVLVNGNRGSVKVQGEFDGQKIVFQGSGLQYTNSGESDSITLKDVVFKQATLDLADSTFNLAGERKAAFENVKIYSTPEKSPLVMWHYERY